MENSSVGVLKKIKDQAKALDLLQDKTIDIIVLNPNREEQNGRIKYIKFKSKRKFPFIGYDYLFKKYKLIENSIASKNYDYIILRYPGADKTGVSFINEHKVILEAHGKVNNVLQAKLNSKTSIFKKIIRNIRLYLENKYATKIFYNCNGFIAVSDEIREYYLNKTDSKLPSIIVSNGCNVTQVKKTGFKNFNNKELDVVFVASRPETWHGLDRLIYSIEKYKKDTGSVNIRLHLVGSICKNDIKKYTTNLENIYFHGVKFGSEFDKIMRNMHIAICPLALYRKKLNETSAIKTCEYIARGIPFILSYKDTILQDIFDDYKFYLTIPNDSSLIDFGVVTKFMNKMTENKNEIINYMRKYAFEYADWTVKMKELIDFTNRLNRS